jgi:PAP2 superfamily
MNIRKITANLHSADILIIGFAAVLTAVNLVFAFRIPSWWRLVLINCGTVALICLLGYARNATGSRVLAFVHDWYVPPMVFFSFKELYFLIKPIHMGADYDDVLIAIDRWMFGVNPTEWLMHIANPPLTEILQIAYTSFYFLFIVVGYELYRRHNLDLFRYFVFIGTYGFFLSYIGYFFLPAVGPRFTLHDFSALDRDLPGLFFTPYLRWFVNAGESIPMGVPNEVSLAGTQRDVFPSGHTMMTLVLMYLSARYNLKCRTFMYVTDLIAGATFMLLCISTAPRLSVYIKRHFATMESRLPPGA